MSDVSFEAEGIRIVGLAGAPEDTRSTRGGMFLFVNDRFVTDQVVNNAVMRAYRGMLGVGRYPQTILFIQIAPGEVDVNIHPAKQAVKFRQPNTVHGVVSRAVNEALRGAFQIPAVSSGEYHDTPPPHPPERPGVGEWGGAYRSGGGMSRSGELFQNRGEVLGFRETFRRAWPMEQNPDPTAVYGAYPSDMPADDEGAGAAIRGEYVLLGQALGTYILLAVEGGVIIIDQHAAHERIVYERLRAGRRTGDVPRQALLFPVTLELTRAEKAILTDHTDEIERLGVTVSDFGGDAVVVESVPAILSESDVSALLQDMIGALKEGRDAGDDVEGVYDRVTALMACHGSVRAGKKLTAPEMTSLINDLFDTPGGNRCPHGRPTSIILTERELMERFKRIP
jgi:DNA mismatch repair protein MutL